MELRPVSREQMDANHAAARARAALLEPQPELVTPRNVQPVLDFGDLTFFEFRGSHYGIPPIGWRDGERLLALWNEALSYPSPLTAETVPLYFRCIEQFVTKVWQLVKPVGKWRRLRHRLGLLRNPFRRATEAEITTIVGFCLGLRMKSSVGFPRAPTPSVLAAPIASTNSAPSATPSPPGSAPTASRARGSTSSTGPNSSRGPMSARSTPRPTRPGSRSRPTTTRSSGPSTE